MFRIDRFAAIGAVLLCGTLNSANAEQVTFTHQGSVSGRTPDLIPFFDAGEPVTLTYTFDSDTPDLSADPTRGFYNEAISGLVLEIGQFTFLASSATIDVRNDFGVNGVDAVVINIFNGLSGPILVGSRIRNISVAWANQDALDQSVLSDDSLPVTPPPFDLTLPNSNSGQVCFFNAGCVVFRFHSTVTNTTPAGENVAITPIAVDVSGNPAGAPVTLTFAEVTSGGETTVTVLDNPGENPGSPADFQVGQPPTYFDLETTAIFTEVEVCIDYSQISFGGSIENLELFHFDETLTPPAWVSLVPQTIDETSQTICGTVDSFSLFAVFEPIPFTVVGLNPPLFDLVPDGDPVLMPVRAFKQGQTLPLQMKLLKDGVALTDADVAAPTIIAVRLVGASLGSPLVDLDSGAANDNGFEFRFVGGFWIYNFGTRELTGRGVYFITIEMPDGFRYQAGFELR